MRTNTRELREQLDEFYALCETDEQRAALDDSYLAHRVRLVEAEDVVIEQLLVAMGPVMRALVSVAGALQGAWDWVALGVDGVAFAVMYHLVCRRRIEAQIARCQTPTWMSRHYCAWDDDARRRMKAGQRQVFCLLCKRWKWPDELCEMGREVTDAASNDEDGGDNADHR